MASATPLEPGPRVARAISAAEAAPNNFRKSLVVLLELTKAPLSFMAAYAAEAPTCEWIEMQLAAFEF